MRAIKKITNKGSIVFKPPSGGVPLGRECRGCNKIFSKEYFFADKGTLTTDCKTCKIERLERLIQNDPSIKLKSVMGVYRIGQRYGERSPRQIAKDRNRVRPDGKKTCSRCKQSLPFDRFYRDVAKVDGLTYACKSCATAYRKG